MAEVDETKPKVVVCTSLDDLWDWHDLLSERNADKENNTSAIPKITKQVPDDCSSTQETEKPLRVHHVKTEAGKPQEENSLPSQSRNINGTIHLSESASESQYEIEIKPEQEMATEMSVMPSDCVSSVPSIKKEFTGDALAEESSAKQMRVEDTSGPTDLLTLPSQNVQSQAENTQDSQSLGTPPVVQPTTQSQEVQLLQSVSKNTNAPTDAGRNHNSDESIADETGKPPLLCGLLQDHPSFSVPQRTRPELSIGQTVNNCTAFSASRSHSHSSAVHNVCPVLQVGFPTVNGQSCAKSPAEKTVEIMDDSSIEDNNHKDNTSIPLRRPKRTTCTEVKYSKYFISDDDSSASDFEPDCSQDESDSGNDISSTTNDTFLVLSKIERRAVRGFKSAWSSDSEQSDDAESAKTCQNQKKHKPRRSGRVEWRCRECGKTLTTKRGLKRHMTSHTKERKYLCEICGKSYQTDCNLRLHMIAKHTDKESYKFKCDICGKLFPLKESLKSHQFTHSGRPRPFKCDLCDKTYSYSRLLEHHRQSQHSDEKSHSCSLCGKTFKTQRMLRNHERRHRNAGAYPCDECDAVLTTRNSLKRHKQSHAGTIEIPCRYCDRIFKSYLGRTQHENKHTNKRPYRCEVCGKDFTSSCNLTDHKRIHTGEKPYKCTVCGKAFTKASNLNTHKRGQHPNMT